MVKNTLSSKGSKRIIFYGIAIILAVLLSTLFILPRAINTAYIKNKLSIFIYQKTGTNINASQFSLAVFPRASISIKDFNFTPDNKTTIYFDSLKFNLHLLTLFQSKLNGHCQFTIPKIISGNNPILFDSPIITSSFKLSDGVYQIDIPSFKLKYPEGSVAIHFTSNQLQKKHNIKFTGTHLHIDQARKMSLLLFKDNEIIKNIFKILHGGIVPEINVSFQSNDLETLFNEKNLMLKGNIENGLVHIPKTPLMVSRVSGNACINQGILDINTDRATLQNSTIEKGRLTIDLLHHTNIPFQSEFLLDVDLSMVPQTLISLLPDTFLSKELSLVHDVTGRSNVKLTLSLGTDSTDLNVNIKTTDFSVTGLYDRIPGDITIKNVNFNYEPDIVSLKHLNGVIHNNTLNDLHLILNFKDDMRISIPSGSGILHLESMIPWLMSYEKTRKIISPIKAGSGHLHITSIDLSGPLLTPDQWEYDLTGTGSDVRLTTQLNHNQIDNLSCQYHLSNDGLSLEMLQMKLNDLSWMDPIIEKKYLESIQTPFNMENGDLQISAKESFFKTDLCFANGLHLSLDLNGKTPASFTLNSIKFIDPGLSNGAISFNHNKENSLFNFKGILDTTTLNKMVVPDSYGAKKINTLTEGQSILIHTDKNNNLNIIARHLDLNPLISESKTLSLDISHLLPDEIIHFKTDLLKIKNLTFSDIDSTLSFKKDQFYIEFKKALLCDLKASGSIHLKTDRITADIPFETNNKANIQDLLTCLFQKNEFMDGHYSLTGNLLSNGSKKDFLNKFAGSFIFNADEGRIYKLTLLSRILSVLNVSSVFKGNIPDVIQKGFAYKNISIKAEIKESIIHLTEAIIDGQDMTLIFNGWIDPINDNIELTCLVVPFKTIDLIIKYIPIINTLLEGRLISVPVKATGKLSDPMVIPLHPSSVGESLIDMMSNILKTPVKLWDTLYSE